MTTKKFSLLLLACLASVGTCTTASALTVGATVDFLDQGTLGAPAPDEFSIINNSDPGIRITSVTIDLTLADTNFAEVDDQTPHFPRWDTVAGCSPDYCYGQEANGQPITGGGSSSGIVGFVSPSNTELAGWDEGLAITLLFTDFGRDEVFGFTGDVDDSFDFRLSGREFAYSTLTVTFEGADLPGGTLTITDRFYADPANRWRAVAHVEADVSAVPVPAAAWLFVSALGLVGVRRRKQ